MIERVENAEEFSVPLQLSGFFAVAAGLVVLWIVADQGAQRTALTATIASVALLAAGAVYRARDRRAAGTSALLLGGLVAFAGLGLAVALPMRFSARVELLPGLVGLPVLTLGALGTGRGRERALVTTGTALLLASVLVSGVVYGASPGWLLAATAGAVVAWDAGEQAVTLREHVGPDATTWTADIVHLAGGLAVGAAAVLIAVAVDSFEVTGLSLSGLVFLLGATVALAIALRN